MNFNKIKNLVTLVLSVIAFTAFSQDINQAGDVFNEGNQALKDNNFELALQKYEKSIEIASKLGEEGEQIVVSAESQIPALYYKMGVSDYKEKMIDKAIGEFEKAIEYGKKYNDPETVTKANETIPKLYYAQGNTSYSEDNYDEALKNFKKAAEMSPDYSRAYWGMGLAYNKLNDNKGMKESFEKALELAKADGDDKMISKITKNAKTLLEGEGAKKLQAQDWDGALQCLNAAVEFDAENADTYYYIALANNGLKKWDEAISSASKGLELSAEKNVEFKAKFYYEMGNALKGQGETSKACEAYNNAQYGSFAESAKYELNTVLKCN